MKNISKRKYQIILWVAAAGIVVAASFLYGVVAGLRNYPPYGLIQASYMRFLKTAHYEEVNPESAKIDPKRFISISSKEDVLSKRRKLIQFIWGTDELPNSQPALIEKNIQSEQFGELPIERVDKIVAQMEYGFDSIIYLLHSKRKNNKLIIYHQGHGPDSMEAETLRFFMEKGFSILYFAMPLSGENSKPTKFLRPLGEIEFERHNDLEYLRSEDFNPIKLFLEPINVGLNYVEQFGYEEIYMMGISGGGWTTTLYSAIDPRVLRSYPVAGTLPIYLREERGYGDWEQSFPELYSIATYLELYIMGSYGEGRRQLQVLNQYDSCCFSGVEYRLYEDTVHNVVASLGKGEFSVFLDSSHREHIISEQALLFILEDISK